MWAGQVKCKKDRSDGDLGKLTGVLVLKEAATIQLYQQSPYRNVT